MAQDIMAAIVLAIWFYLIAAHGGFWRAAERDDALPTAPTRWVAMQYLHRSSEVLDGEIVANDALGRPDFAKLHVRWLGAVHLWGVRPSGVQRPESPSAAAAEAPGMPAGPTGAVRSPNRLAVRTLRTRTGAAARS